MCYFAPGAFLKKNIIMRALGADIKRTPKDEGVIGAQTKASYAQEYGAVYMNQFETEHNPAAYTHTLGKQLTDTLPNRLLCCRRGFRRYVYRRYYILNSIM